MAKRPFRIEQQDMVYCLIILGQILLGMILAILLIKFLMP